MSDGTNCNVKRRNSARSSRYHSGSAANSSGGSEGRGRTVLAVSGREAPSVARFRLPSPDNDNRITWATPA